MMVKKEWCHLEMPRQHTSFRPEFGVKQKYYFVITLDMEAM